MNLRSEQSYWLLKNGLIATYPPLRADESCEVVVIGGGVTGALLAYYFTAAGVSTVLVEKRDIGTGSTAASSALLLYETDADLAELSSQFGEKDATTIYRLGLSAIDDTERLIAELGDDCGFKRRNSLYVATKRSHVARLKTEYELRCKLGFPVEYLDAQSLSGEYPWKGHAALLAYGNAEFDPYRFTHALLRAGEKKGLRVYDRTCATAVQPNNGGFRVTTERGCTVVAKKVAFATGYETQQYLQQKLGALKTTYAIVTEPFDPFPEWPGRCLMWETRRPYMYLRTTGDMRIIAGGEDTDFVPHTRSAHRLETRGARLLGRLKLMFPERHCEIAYAWCGAFGETDDGLPYIGETPELPGAYVAAGYGGNGMTMGLLAARFIRDQYLGNAPEDARLFSFGR